MADTARRQAATAREKPQPRAAAAAPPLWEWAVALAGLVLVLAAAGYLGLHALADETGAPDPAVQVAAIQPRPGGFVVVVQVRNRSRATAAGLKIAGTLRRDGAVVEESEANFQFLPGESVREGGLFFTHDPRAHELELRPQGYEKP